MYWVIVGTDAVGSFVNLLGDDLQLLGGDEVRSGVFQTEDHSEAASIAQMALRFAAENEVHSLSQAGQEIPRGDIAQTSSLMAVMVPPTKNP